MAQEICSIADGLTSDQAPRTTRYQELTSLYEMRQLEGLNAAAYDRTGNTYADIYVPLARSLCDTVQADIAGRQRVKPMFGTTGADWKTRRRAKKLDRFVEACLHQEQGAYTNGWELCDDAFLDAAICGHGVTRCSVDDSMGTPKVVIDRLPPGKLKVDSSEAEKGCPANFFWDDWADEDTLIEAYVDNPELELDDAERELRRGAITSAAMVDESVSIAQHGSTRIARRVLVRYAVRMPLSKDKPGKFVICVPHAVLYEVEYTRQGPPAVVWRWSRERLGFWGTGLVEETKSIVAEFNRGMERLQERMVLCANKRTYIKRGSVEKADMEANEAENIVEVDGEMPVETTTPPFTQQELEYLQLVRGLAFESPGVSQQSATSRKEAGISSGVAIRTMIDLATKRFAIKARYGYEYPFVALAKHIVWACAEYHEATGNDIEVALPTRRSGGAQTVKWSEVKLALESLVVQIAPSSALPDDPAGRLQTVAEAFQQGLMSPATYKRLAAWPDLAAEVDRENAEYEYVESLIDRYLDADADTWEARDYDPPDGFLLGKEGAMVQFAQAYFIAKREKADEFNLELMRRYMLQLGESIDRANAPPDAEAGLGAAPMAAGPPPSPPVGAVPAIQGVAA